MKGCGCVKKVRSSDQAVFMFAHKNHKQTFSALLFYLHKIGSLNDRWVLGRHGDAERSQGTLCVVTSIQMQKVAF